MTMNSCLCPCHQTTGGMSGGCNQCWQYHQQPPYIGDPVPPYTGDPVPNVNVYPDFTSAILQKLSEILEELKEIKKRIG